ncbi:MAG TPA: hypothetical protein VM344_07625, partial [Vitreimonas sp.]|nr:hypothetical protein [Vitreimonas sp.]
MSRRSGVPIERTAAGRYDAGPDLTAANGTVALARPPVARRLAATMNAARLATRNGGPGVQAGELHALGLLHDVFHHLIERYEAEARPGAFRDALAAVAADRGAEAAQR